MLEAHFKKRVGYRKNLCLSVCLLFNVFGIGSTLRNILVCFSVMITYRSFVCSNPCQESSRHNLDSPFPPLPSLTSGLRRQCDYLRPFLLRLNKKDSIHVLNLVFDMNGKATGRVPLNLQKRYGVVNSNMYVHFDNK